MIHETAVIDAGAKLGKDVKVGPFSYIQEDTIIGDGCDIGPNVTILKHTSLGANCEVHSGAVLGDKPQDLSFEEVESYVKIGSNCVIREGVTIHRGTKEGTSTEVGDNCFLMAMSHLAHNVMLGDGVIMANAAVLGGYVEIGENVFIGGNVGVHQFVKIGRLTMLGGACGISKDVPPFCLTRPVDLNIVSGLNVIGLRRAGFSPDNRAEIKKCFKMLYSSGLNVTQAVEKMKAEVKSDPAMEFCEFIDKSDRGICGMGE